MTVQRYAAMPDSGRSGRSAVPPKAAMSAADR